MPARTGFLLGGEEEHVCKQLFDGSSQGHRARGCDGGAEGCEEGRGPGVTACVSPVPAAAKLCGVHTASESAIAPGNQDLSCSTAGEYAAWLPCES